MVEKKNQSFDFTKLWGSLYPTRKVFRSSWIFHTSVQQNFSSNRNRQGKDTIIILTCWGNQAFGCLKDHSFVFFGTNLVFMSVSTVKSVLALPAQVVLTQSYTIHFSNLF